MPNPSPLRYPGGKYKICSLIELLLSKAGDDCCVYAEPFAGGAGIALNLLLRNVVSEIVINDCDSAVYSFWRAVVCDTDEFLDMLYRTPVTIREWQRQKEVYLAARRYSVDYGFATFFLNRTNRSGILSSGPIGGVAQNDWTLDARYNKDNLADKIATIGRLRRRIHVFNRDVLTLISSQLKRYGERVFTYFDPPYYCKGKELYQNYFDDKKHKALCAKIKAEVRCPWIVSYDDVPQIRGIYQGFPMRSFSLNYSLANNGSGREIMFFGRKALVPTQSEIQRIGMSENFNDNT